MQISPVAILGFLLLEGVLGNPISPHGVTKHRRDSDNKVTVHQPQGEIDFSHILPELRTYRISHFPAQSMTPNTMPGKSPTIVALFNSLLT
ncbi:hypothetical protein MJO28_005572 [Puccinia striiformis f. sp. tritici]|uniref:Uncharacterized protein n=1 Tax=Puccinia striiformis f. sp. tritici TaxID=168172 RepID=A0ACC0EKE9_9BASI|nr:hypothetical protein MJO28_005572 [Puccinia striiformis f. sp. tritici]